MKFLIAASFLIVAVCAVPRIPIFRPEMEEPYGDIEKYFQCVTPTIDLLVEEYDCKETWDQYREGFLQAVDEFEQCSPVYGEIDIDDCNYRFFKSAQNILNQFYRALDKQGGSCSVVIPRYVQDFCQGEAPRLN